MFSEPRTISLISEFVHIPTVHAAERLRQVYNEVCRTCGYENFTRVQGGARIERRSPDSEALSQLTILGDRVQFTEDHTGISVEQLGKKIVGALATVMPTLGIPMLLIQQCKVRMTTTPTRHATAAEFLAERVFRVDPAQVEPLGRPVGFFGFRLLFPGSSDQPTTYNVRIESYVRDAKALYIENLATVKQPIQQANVKNAGESLRTASVFLKERVLPFLASYEQENDG